MHPARTQALREVQWLQVQDLGKIILEHPGSLEKSSLLRRTPFSGVVDLLDLRQTAAEKTWLVRSPVIQ